MRKVINVTLNLSLTGLVWSIVEYDAVVKNQCIDIVRIDDGGEVKRRIKPSDINKPFCMISGCDSISYSIKIFSDETDIESAKTILLNRVQTNLSYQQKSINKLLEHLSNVAG